MSLSPRLAAIVDALPLDPTTRVLEIGCGPGAAAREVARRAGHVLAIDRSPTAIRQVTTTGAAEIAAGRLSVRCVAIEDLVLGPDDEPFDLAFAVRVGVLDGRHPAAEARALAAVSSALRPGGRLVVDGVERVPGAPAPRPPGP
ncbi:methyltransferase domain-containing protein [Actinomycetospora sp. OC33-EN08]|uniref:Methyltransferase domain-containing protein n=1 Tax=Actinomycetospora aurantiaca TaxID=3129233 RepID=A0ABU8MX75_9PSEU